MPSRLTLQSQVGRRRRRGAPTSLTMGTMTAMDGVEQQVAVNEVTFRSVNEGIEEGRNERDGRVPFVCECGVIGCNAIVELTLREYESVRAGGRCFVVAPGHGATFDEVSYEQPRYRVVRKPEGPLGDLAERTDPRQVGG
jgi:hypothetical protein